MVSRLLRIVSIAVVAALALSFGSVLFAGEAAVALPAFDWQSLVQALFAAALPFLVQLFRTLKPTMPRLLVWALPPVLGLLIQWLASLAELPGFAGWKGFVAGLVAIALREFASTLKEHGVNG